MVFDWATAEQADVEVTDRLLDVNLSSAAAATRLLLPRLLDSEPSALVYIGSGASRQAFAHNAAYVASKHGLPVCPKRSGRTYVTAGSR